MVIQRLRRVSGRVGVRGAVQPYTPAGPLGDEPGRVWGVCFLRTDPVDERGITFRSIPYDRPMA